MIKVDACVICGSELGEGRNGVVAPFLARRIWQREAFPVRLEHCTGCGFEFYNPRLEAEDEKKLYENYRSDAYQRMRQHTEPWYTEKFNRALADEKSWRERTQLLRPVIQGALAGRQIRSVLDFGGDRGELVQYLFPGADRYVYDISGVPPVEGVTALHSEAECKQKQFDLIVTSNLLEHVGFPVQIMESINAIASPGTLVFHEVPSEPASGGATMFKRVAQLGVLSVTRPTVAGSLLRHGGGMRLMHEHVNYFGDKALHQLMARSGWRVLSGGRYNLGTSARKGQMLWVLAERETGASQ